MSSGDLSSVSTPGLGSLLCENGARIFSQSVGLFCSSGISSRVASLPSRYLSIITWREESRPACLRSHPPLIRRRDRKHLAQEVVRRGGIGRDDAGDETDIDA